MDLTTISTEDLMDELLSRVDNGAIMLQRLLKDGETLNTRRWKGTVHSLSGMATDFQLTIFLKAYQNKVQNDEEWA